MERGDLLALGTQTLERFFNTPWSPEEAEGFALRISSGTTSGVPLVLVTEHPSLNTEAASRAWWGGSEHTLVCYGSRNLRLFNALSAKKYSNVRGALLALGAEDLCADLTDILADFMPRRIIGSPSFIARAAAYMNEHTRSGVLFIQCAGETVSTELAAAFSAQFPHATLRSVYTAVDVGPIVYASCGHLPFNHYHPREDIRITIHAPDERGVGDILISTEVVRDMRLEEYRIGDVGRLFEQPCVCGKSTVLEVLGRAGFDYVKLAGAIIRQEEFDRVIAKLNTIDDYRAVFSLSHTQERVQGVGVVHVYRRDGIGTPALAHDIAQKIEKELFVTPTRTWAQLAEDGTLRPLEVMFVAEPFPLGHKSVRLRLI